MKYVEREEVKIVDFKITTLLGRWNHLSIPVERLNEKVFTDGIGFDGSRLWVFHNRGFRYVLHTRYEYGIYRFLL